MEKNEVLVKVEGLSKKFCKDLKKSLWYGVQDLFSNVRGNKKERQLRDQEFWALQDVNFELRRGECLGLIGHNGAGKSTLLKILNGLIKPDAGKVTIKGRVGALIELGAGFNPILTGRENIYNNGAILGFSRRKIDEKLEEIVDFAEIREFIDTPVQNYSSGMKVRLGFAVAAQMEPDVLIIDEVLAVGDVGFRVKCLNKISELLKTCAVIIVSHSMPQIARIATNGIVVHKGLVELNSKDISHVISTYNSKFEIGNRISKKNKELDFGPIKLNKKIMYPDEEVHLDYLSSFFLEYYVINPNYKRDLVVGIRIAFMDVDQKICAEVRCHKTLREKKSDFLHVKIDELMLANGVYALNFEIFEWTGKTKGKIYWFEKNYAKIIVSNVRPSLAPVVFKNSCLNE